MHFDIAFNFGQLFEHIIQIMVFLGKLSKIFPL